MEYSQAMDLIKYEYIVAKNNFPTMRSNHEGYAILKEEVDELWNNIKGNTSNEALIHEAKQVGAMALRFLIDCC